MYQKSTLLLYDPDNKGIIQTTQLIASLRKIRIVFDDNDLSLILEKYEDKEHDHCILWKSLANDVCVPLTESMYRKTVRSQVKPTMKDLVTSSRTTQAFLSSCLRPTEQTEDKEVPENLIPLY